MAYNLPLSNSRKSSLRRQLRLAQARNGLNRFAHFKTTLDDISIHFIHERGKGPNPFPLILTHGYPDA
jgi:hypothetical protein